MGGVLPPARFGEPDIGALSGGRGHASGCRCADGGDLGTAGGIGLDGGPRFDGAAPAGGHAWWYADAISSDGRHGFTIIAFLASVFSPYCLRSGKAKPENHVALNVALYGSGARWAPTERSVSALRGTADSRAIGPSSLHWDGAVLSIQFDERGAVFGEKVRGGIRIRPETLAPRGFDLDTGGRHHWRPIATRAHVEARFRNPALSWQGEAYVDSNFGDEPMEDRFSQWQWSRAHLGRDSAVFYEGALRDGKDFALALRFDRHGEPHVVDAPPEARLAPTKWLMPRQTRADAGSRPRVVKTWEDVPFYRRSAVASRLWGEDSIGVHECLSLARFVHPAAQWMIPWRLPRTD